MPMAYVGRLSEAPPLSTFARRFVHILSGAVRPSKSEQQGPRKAAQTTEIAAKLTEASEIAEIVLVQLEWPSP